jgi:hypothetical protein
VALSDYGGNAWVVDITRRQGDHLRRVTLREHLAERGDPHVPYFARHSEAAQRGRAHHRHPGGSAVASHLAERLLPQRRVGLVQHDEGPGLDGRGVGGLG